MEMKNVEVCAPEYSVEYSSICRCRGNVSPRTSDQTIIAAGIKCNPNQTWKTRGNQTWTMREIQK